MECVVQLFPKHWNSEIIAFVRIGQKFIAIYTICSENRIFLFTKMVRVEMEKEILRGIAIKRKKTNFGLLA